MEIADILQKAFDRYFNILRKHGYADNSYKKILLVLSAINTIFDSELLYFVTEDDYRELYKAIICLANLDCCLVDIPLKLGDSLYKKVKSNVNRRITEDGIFRITEDNVSSITE